jgi:hypothetical protein
MTDLNRRRRRHADICSFILYRNLSILFIYCIYLYLFIYSHSFTFLIFHIHFLLIDWLTNKIRQTGDNFLKKELLVAYLKMSWQINQFYNQVIFFLLNYIYAYKVYLMNTNMFFAFISTKNKDSCHYCE